MRDAREAKLAEERATQLTAQLQATLEASGDGILVLDIAGNVINMNRRCSQMWGIPEAVLRQGDQALLTWLDERLTVACSGKRLSQADDTVDDEKLEILELIERQLLRTPFAPPDGEGTSHRSGIQLSRHHRSGLSASAN